MRSGPGNERSDAAPVEPSRITVGLSLVSVYLIWGSTYLAMRIAMEVWPAFLMGGVRFSVAGVVLAVVLRVRGAAWPSGREWIGVAAVGVLLLALGNGLVAVAESGDVDSGVAATVVATMPMWMAGIGTALGERPSRLEWAGLVLGFTGVAILHSGGSLHLGDPSTVAILLAPVAWASGSVALRRLPMPRGLMATAMQMVVGGAVMIGVSFVRGEMPLHGSAVRATLALGYLVVFGSLLGFSAYGFLLRNTRAAVASSYAYVNPVVALVLGSLLGNERLSIGKLAACGVIVMGVVLATRRTREQRASAPNLPSRVAR